MNTVRSMKIFSFSSFLKSVLLIVIIVLSFNLGYNAGINTTIAPHDEPPISTTPSVTPNETPTQLTEEPWKHFQFNGYSDTRKLGFGIDYPGNWQKPVIKNNFANTTIYFDDGFYVTFGDFYDLYKRKIMSFDEVVASHSIYHTVTDFTLNGVRGKKLVSQSTADPGGVRYIFPGNYVIHYGLPESDSLNYTTTYPIAQKRLDRMIASLYFADKNGDINPIDPETKWHIYNDTYYSFQYPANWHQNEGTSCPAFSEAMGGRYTFYVCFSSAEHPHLLYHSLTDLREGYVEVSRIDTVVDNYKGIKQVTKFAFQGGYLYTLVVYISNNGNELEISAAGIPEDEKESAFALVESIIKTFNLNY